MAQQDSEHTGPESGPEGGTDQDEVQQEQQPGTDVELQVASPLPVTQFEGEFITDSEAKMPAVVFELPEGYARGTILRLAVEVRVKNIGYNENRKGDLVRVHTLALNSVGLNAAFRPEHRRDDVEGDASGAAVPTSQQNEALGVNLSRSADAWGRPDSAVDPDGPTPEEVAELPKEHVDDQDIQDDGDDQDQHAVGF